MICGCCSLAAEGLGLPFVPPFLAHNGSFRRGANFAVGGATAIDAGFFHDDGEPPDASKFPLNTSLGVQIQWFESLVPSLCATTQGACQSEQTVNGGALLVSNQSLSAARAECKELFGRSLFFIGELGYNDYSFSLVNGKSVQQLISLAPAIIDTISIAIEVISSHSIY